MKMLICAVCNCTDFYKASGYFFCATCQTQSQDIREEVELELPIENTIRLRKTKIRRIRSDKTDKELGWTSWELYNFVLIGLTNELIELGVTPDIKITVLELWARYLGKLEVAFTSTKRKLVPKLARSYKKRDAEIIYGKILSQKKARRRRKSSNSVTDSTASTCFSEETSLRELNRNKKLMISADYDRFVQSQASSEGDTFSTFSQSVHSVQSTTKQSENSRLQFNFSAKEEAKKVKNLAKKVPKNKRSKYKQNYVTTQYKTGPELITPAKLWAILYLALRIHKQDIHLGDMLRYGREGHLSYYKLNHLIPPEVILTGSDINFLSRVTDITHKGMRQIIGRMAKFLGVVKIICPDFLSLINRYCSELDLPRGVSLYAERLVALSPPKMKFHNKSCIPNYEGRAMAFIIVVLKILLGLDGITEYEISNVAERINGIIADEGICDMKLFSFREWQRYIDGRKTVLMNVHCPTKLKYRPNIADVNSSYIKFLESIDSKVDREDPEITTHKHLISRELVNAMQQCITNISYINLPLNEENKFPPSLTPHHSYLQQLLEHTLHDVPSILRNGFSSTKIGYMTKPEFIYKLTSQYDIQLDFVYSNLHFIEKTVSPFEQTKISSVKDLNDDIEVQDFVDKSTEDIERNEDFINYLHRKRPCQLKIDMKKRQYFDYMQNTITDMKSDPPLAWSNEFIFNEILPDGKLSISDNDNNEDKDNDAYLRDIVPEETKLLLNVYKAYAINLSDTEKKGMFQDLSCMKQQKRKLFRNAQGKFVKHSAISTSQDKDPNQDEYKGDTAELISSENLETKNLLPEISDILNLSINASVFDDLEISEYSVDQSKDYRKIFESAIEDSLFNTLDKKSNIDSNNSNKNNILRLFTPFKDYWMYHCNFSRVKLKNFELLEKMLPRSFRWLLNECANIIEMSTEDLYKEVCLVEAYHARVSKQFETYMSDVTGTEDCNDQTYTNAILKEW